jgi:DNA-binding NarL/FixJ family response regulator
VKPDSEIRILLAEDHTLVRAGIRSLLDRIGGMTVVAEASDGTEAVRLARKHQPQLVVMDIGMAGLNGLEATRRIRSDNPEARILILSMHANEQYVHQALQAGASGYLLKDAATEELELAIQAAFRGQTYLSPRISRQLVEDYLKHGEANPADQLTPRQREILQLIAEGRSTRAIAERLHVSIKTVETHRAQLMDRLDIHDVPGLVRFAIRSGVISAEE